MTRQSSTCTLCHGGPFPNPHLQGTIGPDLHGVGARLTPAEIHARLVNPAALNPDTVMPAFGLPPTAPRLAPAFRTPILSPQDIDDATAFLATLQ